MGLIILVVGICAPLLIAGLVVFFVFRGQNADIAAGMKRVAELNERAARATPAQATVISHHTLGTYQDGSLAFVKIQLQIGEGGGRFATTEWELNISSLTFLQPGQSVAIKIDSINPELIYPNVSWAKLSREYLAHGAMGGQTP